MTFQDRSKMSVLTERLEAHLKVAQDAKLSKVTLFTDLLDEAVKALERTRHDIRFLLACLDMCDEAEAPPSELDALDLAILGDIRRDSDGTATAAACKDMPVPQDCQARPVGIAPNPPPSQSDSQ